MVRLVSWSRAVALLAIALTGAGAHAEDFYRGKTINLYIGFAPGGSYDFYGRAVARHIGRHIAGAPTVVPQSMPGAGSLRAANYLYAVAAKDGTAMGIVSQTLPLEEALGNPAAKYKTRDFTWIGRVTDVADVAVGWHTAKAQNARDTMTIETTMANTGPGSTTYGFPKLLNELAGTKFKLVRGYPGSTDAMLAMERGETDASSTSWNTLRNAKAHWVRDRHVNVLLLYTQSRIMDLPDVPAAPELGKTDDDKRILSFYASSAEIGRSIIAPPGLPGERTDDLRRAFTATMNDAEFRAELDKAKADYAPLPGAEMQRKAEEMAAVAPALIERMKQVMNAPD